MKVSIITVVYNAENTIADALNSVASQDFSKVNGVVENAENVENNEIEHIVVDGASTDNTLSVIKQFDHIAKIISEPDSGIYDAMNKGVQAATGDIIGILNADDVYQDETVVSQAVAAIQENKVDACYSDLVYVKQQDMSQVVRYWTSRDYQQGLCFKGWMPAHPTLFLRKEVYERTGLFNTDLDYQADLEFCARLFEKTKISSIYIPEIWVRMRMGGVTNGSFKTMWKGNWESYRALSSLGMNTNPVRFFWQKFSPKLSQYWRKPIAKSA